jgi:phenylalanyl-tRNA synthetase alpha chain
LPERVLLNKLVQKERILIGEIRNVCSLNENEAKIALGTLKKKALVDIQDGRVVLTARPEEVSKKSLEELFLESLPRDSDSLQPQEHLALNSLIKRKDIVEVRDEKKVSVKLTELGVEALNGDLSGDYIEQVTSKLIKGMGWKGKKFRRYDLSAPVPRLYGGKRHFTNQAVDYAKNIWRDMGFREMSGNMVESGFWVFDSLFTAQDHPVREMQDTFFIKDATAKLPDKKLVSEVKRAHEGGVDDSLGWQYKWDSEDSKKVLLRTHTTALSVHQLVEVAKNKEFPAKYFAMGKCFRNETVDWSHGFEFIQTEGIVVDENANFRQLIGYLLQFYRKMGFEKVRVRPAYFAYTEPSLEIDVFHPVHKKWVELGGAGMFRPEVTVPIFGRHIPVLAWGQGVGRIMMEYYKILDLREMYKNDINKLREMKFWRK